MEPSLSTARQVLVARERASYYRSPAGLLEGMASSLPPSAHSKMRVDCGKKETIIVKNMIVFLEMSWAGNYRYYLMYDSFSIGDE